MDDTNESLKETMDFMVDEIEEIFLDLEREISLRAEEANCGGPHFRKCMKDAAKYFSRFYDSAQNAMRTLEPEESEELEFE